MSGFEAKPAKRENVGLLIGLAGGTGAGKSYSALRIASGLVRTGERFVVIDTESRRALHYADEFTFDHVPFDPPFSPQRYREAIEAQVGTYRVIVVDSASHEHAGEGGVLDMQEAELQRMAGDDWKKREACKMASWVRPKQSHKRMMQKIIATPPGTHLILCFRAEEKIEMAKEDGKTVVRAKRSLVGLDGWIPIAGKDVPFELTLSLLLLAQEPGLPHPIKLPEKLRGIVAMGKPLDETVGRKLAEWAAGGVAPAPKKAEAPAAAQSGDRITAEQSATIEQLVAETGTDVARLLSWREVDCVESIPAKDFDRAVKRLELTKNKKAAS